MTQDHVFISLPPTRCGYCGRPLVARGENFACPRCEPLLAKLGEGLDTSTWLGWRKLVARWKDFQREAHRDRVRP